MRTASSPCRSSASALASPGARSAGMNSIAVSASAIGETISAPAPGCHQKTRTSLATPPACGLNPAVNDTTLKQLQEADRAFHLHPFTHHLDMHAQGTHVIESAEGCFLTDATGRRLLDGLAGLWCVNVGYGRREIVEAVHAQMSRLPYYCSFFNTTNEPAIRLAQRLARLAPPRLQHTLFSNSGSEANETALKIIRAWQKLRGKTGKSKIFSR